MSTLTSQLILKVSDDDLQKKLRADAAAASKFGASLKDLSRLKATPGGAALGKQLDTLGKSLNRLDKLGAAQKGLDGLGKQLRTQRVEVERYAKAMVAAEKKVSFFDRSKRSGSANYGAFVASGDVAKAAKDLKAATRAHVVATRTLGGLEAAFSAARTTARGMAAELQRSGVPVANIGRAQADLRGKIEATTRSLHQQARALGVSRANAPGQLAAAVAAGRASRDARLAGQAEERARRSGASAGMIAGMGAVGGPVAREAAARARVAHGMGAPSRAAAERAAAEAAEHAERAAEARATRRQAQSTILGAGGLYLGHKTKERQKEILETYAEFDDLSRYQAAVADLSPDELKSRQAQALKIGHESGRYNDLQVLHAQLDLAQRGVKKQFIEPFVGEVVNYGRAMNTDLSSAAKTLEGIVFSTNQNVEDPATALTTMRRQVDLAVKMSKLGGLSNDDVAQAFKFGGTSGSGAGLSNETMGAVFAILHRSGYTGSEAGVAQRALAGKLVSPTQKGFGALDAMLAPQGKRWEDFTTLKRGGNADLADNAMQRKFGTKLTAKQRTQFDALFQDEEVFGDQGKFITAATKIVSSNFDKVLKGPNKGKLKAQDAAKIAKTFSDLRKMMIESVDAEGLWDAILQSDPTLAQANAWGTDKHGGKIMALARKYHEYKDYRDQLKATPEGFAKGIGDTRNAGYAGARHRLAGAQKNLDSRIGQSLDGGGGEKGGFLTDVTNAAGHAVQSLAELPNSILAVGAAAAYVGGKVSSALGAAALTGAAAGISAGVATGKGGAIAAGALGAAGLAAPLVGTGAIGLALVMADKSKGIVHGGKNVDTKQDFSDVLPGLDAENVRRAQRTPSLPPGTAGMPAPAPVRLPGLDGRPKVQPEVEDGALARLHRTADETRASLEQAGNTRVAPVVDTSSLSNAQGIAEKLLSTLQAIPGAAAGAIAAIGNAGQVGRLNAARARASFSDGVTPGAGAE